MSKKIKYWPDSHSLTCPLTYSLFHSGSSLRFFTARIGVFFIDVSIFLFCFINFCQSRYSLVSADRRSSRTSRGTHKTQRRPASVPAAPVAPAAATGATGTVVEPISLRSHDLSYPPDSLLSAAATPRLGTLGYLAPSRHVARALLLASFLCYSVFFAFFLLRALATIKL